MTSTRSVRASLASLASLAVWLAACGNGGASGSPAPASVCASLASVLAECGGGAIGAPDAVAAEATCVESLSLPGTPAASAYQACAKAIAATACADGVSVPECDLRGSLAAGAACNTYLQCQSAVCAIPAGATCGTCAAVIADGQACPTGAGCRAGATCLGGTCTAVAYGGAGASCDGVAKLCESDLVCESGTGGACSALPARGQTCGTTSGVPSACAPPYVCDVATNRCSPAGGAGSACPCQPGFGCATSADGGAGTCVSAAGIAPGQPCSQTQLCATGACDPAKLVCPAVLADGEACDAASTTAVCGNASSCAKGACASLASTVIACK